MAEKIHRLNIALIRKLKKQGKTVTELYEETGVWARTYNINTFAFAEAYLTNTKAFGIDFSKDLAGKVILDTVKYQFLGALIKEAGAAYVFSGYDGYKTLNGPKPVDFGMDIDAEVIAVDYRWQLPEEYQEELTRIETWTSIRDGELAKVRLQAGLGQRVEVSAREEAKLVEELMSSINDGIIGFGQHRGKHLCDIYLNHRNYYDWLAKEFRVVYDVHRTLGLISKVKRGAKPGYLGVLKARYAIMKMVSDDIPQIEFNLSEEEAKQIHFNLPTSYTIIDEPHLNAETIIDHMKLGKILQPLLELQDTIQALLPNHRVTLHKNLEQLFIKDYDDTVRDILKLNGYKYTTRYGCVYQLGKESYGRKYSMPDVETAQHILAELELSKEHILTVASTGIIVWIPRCYDQEVYRVVTGYGGVTGHWRHLTDKTVWVRPHIRSITRSNK